MVFCLSNDPLARSNVRNILSTCHSVFISIIKFLLADLDLIFKATVGFRFLIFTALKELGVLALTWLTLKIVSIIVVAIVLLTR